VICGPTGIGKTKIAIEIAEYLKCEIISADSRQIFREMTVGTAVPEDREMKNIPHHFIRSHSIHDYYNASMFEQEVLGFLENYFSSNEICLMVGGSGLYIDAVCHGIDELPSIDMKIRDKWQKIFEKDGLVRLQKEVLKIDPQYFETVDKENPKRLLKAIEVFEITGKPYTSFLDKEKKPRPFHTLKLGLNTNREKLYEQINKRVDRMIDKGLLTEARSLHRFKDLTPLKTVGYKELFDAFEGKLSVKEAVEQIKNHSRAYARRQLTWFRRDKNITWFDPEEIDNMKAYIRNSLG
jgi:tRNA dimethylallyltransferase